MPREHNHLSKFQLRGVGDLIHPGRCLTCGSGTCTKGFIDLGTYFDYEGQMYLCINCISEAAEIAGCLSAEESEQLQSINANIAIHNSVLKEALEDANQRLAAVDVLSPRPVDVPDLSLDLITGNEAVELLDESESGLTGESVNGTDDGESVSEESVKSGNGSGSSRPKRSNSIVSSASGAGLTL